ncbi:MAG: AAA family ATPase [archaeon]
MIIGITGSLGAGKGTIVDFLKTKGFVHFSSTEDVINKEIVRRGLPINRDSMVLIGNDLRKKHGPGYIAEELLRMAEETGKDAVFESIRTEGEIIALRKKGNCVMFAVDADQRTRYDRIIKRKELGKDNISFEKFQEQEAIEMTSKDPWKQNLSRCIEISDYKFMNDDNFEELYEKIEKVLENTKK